MMDTQMIPAKRVYLYKNGVTANRPKCMVVNDRQIRDFGTFLTIATSDLRAPVAIRNIYTPAGGHKVNRLDDLETGRYYVAGGSENFKKVKYGNETKRLLARRQQRELVTLPTRNSASVVVASARYRKLIEKPCVIHVFRNGDERYRGARVLIPRRMMGSWEYVLELVTEKSCLTTPAKRLCTLDGQVLHAVSELQDGGKYVALIGTKSFQKVSYSALEEKKSLFKVAVTVPRTMHRLKKRLPPRPRAAKRNQEVEIVKLPPIDTTHKNFERRKSRPFGGRKNKEGRKKGIEDHRADSVFGGSPVRPTYSLEPLEPAKSTPVSTHKVSVTQENKESSATTFHQTVKTLDSPVVLPPDAHEDKATSSPAAQDTVDAPVEEDEVMEDLDTSMPVEEALNQPTKEERSGNASLDEAGDVEEVLEEAGDTEGDKTTTPEPTQVVTQNTDEGLHYGKANKQELKELESQPLQNSVDLSLQRNKMLSTSSRQSSATKSRSQSVNKLNPESTTVKVDEAAVVEENMPSEDTSTTLQGDQTQVLSGLNTGSNSTTGVTTTTTYYYYESTPVKVDEAVSEDTSATLQGDQTQVLSGLNTGSSSASGVTTATTYHQPSESTPVKVDEAAVVEESMPSEDTSTTLQRDQTKLLSGLNTSSSTSGVTTTTTYHYYQPTEGTPVKVDEAAVVESRVEENLPSEDTSTTLHDDQGSAVEEISEQIVSSDESKPDNHMANIEAPEVPEEVVEEDRPVETSRISPTAEPETAFVIEDSQTDS